MIATLLFAVFIITMMLGVPIGASLGLAGAAAIALANAQAPWFGLLAVPQNFYAGLGKYPLLAIPMFVLVGSIFDRSGVALRLVNFAIALVGRGPGMLPLVAICVAMFLGGISGSGPANAAAVGAVMIAAMNRAGYPASYSASVVGAAAATDILIPPSVAFIVYSVLVPGASVPALFAAGMIPGVLAGIALIVPAVWMARKHGMGHLESSLPRPPLLKSFIDAIWGLAAPVLILGGMRMGWFTPTEAAVVAVFYGLFVGLFGTYLAGAARIVVTDPYLRLFHQQRNLMELLETISKHASPDAEVAVHVVTVEDEFHADRQTENFQKMADACASIGITLTWAYDTTGTRHDRDITTDHGWKIVLSRGLDVFQRFELNEAFSFANRMQQHRQCKEFNVTFVKLA